MNVNAGACCHAYCGEPADTPTTVTVSIIPSLGPNELWPRGGEACDTQPIVVMHDAGGNVVDNFDGAWDQSASWSIIIIDSSDGGSVVCSKNVVAGFARFGEDGETACSLDAAGAHTLVASITFASMVDGSSVTLTTSASVIDVAIGPPAALVWKWYPDGGYASGGEPSSAAPTTPLSQLRHSLLSQLSFA